MAAHLAGHTVDKFDYKYVPVNDLVVETEIDDADGKQKVSHILVQGEPIKPTNRFWTSLFARFGFNKSFFRYFDYPEVFERISERNAGDRMRLCVERGEDDNGPISRLMAVSNPKKPLVVYDELTEMLDRYDGKSINYTNGIVESTHTPRAGGTRFECLGDMFENRFVMSTPIDGYGLPNIYLSLLRIVCENGLIGYTKAFKSSLALGKASDDVTPTMTRALDGFNSDEGYAALRGRIESAGKSWLSIYESQSLWKMLVKLHSNDMLLGDGGGTAIPKGTRIGELLSKKGSDDDVLGSPIIKAFHRLTGDPSESYGLANLDSLSAKRQRTLPVDCKMYEALNFATEVATHYATPEGARQLQSWVGGTVQDEFDMENTCDKFGEFADFLVDSKMAAGMTGSEFAGAGAHASLN